MKKTILLVGLLLALCIGCLLTVNAALEDTTPDLSIDFVNLSYSDAVYIKYAISAKNITPDDVRLLVWREANTNGYVYGTQDEIVLPAYLDTIEDEQYIIFDYKNIAAKEMGDDIYVRAVVEVDGTRYESKTAKYSVLRYAYDTIHDETADDVLQELMQDMLAYGSTAQKLFDYKAPTPVYNKEAATIDWYDIAVVNGKLADGFSNGLIYQNTEFTITATPAQGGKIFSHWENSAGQQINANTTCNVTAGKSETYIAVYKTPTRPSLGLEYVENVEGGETVSYSVSGIGSCKDAHVILPTLVNGLPLTGIADYAFYECTNLISVTISDSVTSIGEFAFRGCTNLTSINIPDRITNIGIHAFSHCKSLITINIPDSITDIQFATFYNCTSLVSIKLPSSITSIGEAAFSNCTSLTTIDIPDSVIRIRGRAFEKCTSLTSITIPSSVTSIGGYDYSEPGIGDNGAFKGCTSLKDVIFENPIGWCYAFSSNAVSSTALAESDLADPAKAAEYLRSTYCIYYWKRN